MIKNLRSNISPLSHFQVFSLLALFLIQPHSENVITGTLVGYSTILQF